MQNKLKTEKFIQRAIKVHGDKYDYSLVDYIHIHEKVKIICPTHGIFEQVANSHIRGSGCSECIGTKKLTSETFIRKAIKVHGDKYDYSLVDYFNSQTKVRIICNEHGVFEQKPNSHLQGHGCDDCSGTKKSTSETFIQKAIKIHGEIYDYSLVEYINNQTKVKIICEEHGIFEQKPNAHLSSKGCHICSGKQKLTTEIFIEKSIKVHGYKYDYSLVHYKNSKSEVKIICKEHGIFEQIPYSHLNGNGCDVCGGTKKSTTEFFIKNAVKVHGDKYDYSLVDYVGSKSEVKIICKEHGVFYQIPNSHLRGAGCPACKESIGEKNICKYLEENDIIFIRQYKFDDCKYKRLLSFDFYIPSHNMCLEFDGIQHYEHVTFFGDKKSFSETKIRDNIKNDYCLNNNIKLIRIRYDENIEDILNLHFN